MDVKKKRTDVIAKLKDSTENMNPTSSDKYQPNMRVLSEMWLDNLRLTRKASTIVKYTNQLACHILPAFGDLQLSEIDNKAMIDFTNNLVI